MTAEELLAHPDGTSSAELRKLWNLSPGGIDARLAVGQKRGLYFSCMDAKNEQHKRWFSSEAARDAYDARRPECYSERALRMLKESAPHPITAREYAEGLQTSTDYASQCLVRLMKRGIIVRRISKAIGFFFATDHDAEAFGAERLKKYGDARQLERTQKSCIGRNKRPIKAIKARPGKDAPVTIHRQSRADWDGMEADTSKAKVTVAPYQSNYRHEVTGEVPQLFSRLPLGATLYGVGV